MGNDLTRGHGTGPSDPVRGTLGEGYRQQGQIWGHVFIPSSNPANFSTDGLPASTSPAVRQPLPFPLAVGLSPTTVSNHPHWPTILGLSSSSETPSFNVSFVGGSPAVVISPLVGCRRGAVFSRRSCRQRCLFFAVFEFLAGCLRLSDSRQTVPCSSRQSSTLNSVLPATRGFPDHRQQAKV
jgi:hypothetical protein